MISTKISCFVLCLFSAINETLSELDISWNHLRGKGALAVAVGVKVGVLDVFFNIYHSII